MPEGGYLVVLIFLCSWGNDTLAYCVGVLFGKHKMSPTLSPKKSIEGLVGGIMGAGILGLLYGLFLQGRLVQINANVPVILFIVCALGAIPAVIGDLAASAIKRNNDVKDYGKLIPGHGGVLDRFDSMIFTAPIIYYLVQFVVARG
jgi:phosphatidate cytidylyltransferase